MTGPAIAEETTGSNRTGLSRWRVYGTELATDVRFRSRLAPGGRRPPDLSFRCTRDPLPEGARDADLLYASPLTDDAGQSLLEVRARRDHHLFSFLGVADYLLHRDRIVAHLRDTAPDWEVEVHFLGIVLAFWLELRGRPVLHASAVTVDGRAVAFLASRQGGKTGLAASFLEAGEALLTDDRLPLAERDGRVFALPGYPQMRMWPDLAARFSLEPEGLERVHPRGTKRHVPIGPDGLGRFDDRARPLARVYLPERRPPAGVSGPSVDAVPPGGAFRALLRDSFLARIVEAAGLQPGRLDLLARTVCQIPFRRLIYPEGLDRLGEVREAVRADLAGDG